jgi:hypothetical protein
MLSIHYHVISYNEYHPRPYDTDSGSYLSRRYAPLSLPLVFSPLSTTCSHLLPAKHLHHNPHTSTTSQYVIIKLFIPLSLSTDTIHT